MNGHLGPNGPPVPDRAMVEFPINCATVAPLNALANLSDTKSATCRYVKNNSFIYGNESFLLYAMTPLVDTASSG